MKAISVDGEILKCPKCDFNHMTQIKTRTFFRDHETSKSGVFASVTRGNVVVANGQNSNPSQHRDGILITLICEECGERHNLAIVQHKGQTMIYWVAR